MKESFFTKILACFLAIAISFGSVTPSFAAEATASESGEQLAAPTIEFDGTGLVVTNNAQIAVTMVAGLVPKGSTVEDVDSLEGVRMFANAGENANLKTADFNIDILSNDTIGAGEYNLFAYAKGDNGYESSELTIQSHPIIKIVENDIEEALNVCTVENTSDLYFDGITPEQYEGVLVRYHVTKDGNVEQDWCLADKTEDQFIITPDFAAGAESWGIDSVEAFYYKYNAYRSTFTWDSYSNVVMEGEEPEPEPEPQADLTMDVVEDAQGNVIWKVTNHTEESKDIEYGFATAEQIANGTVQDPYGTTIRAGEDREFNAASFALHYPTTPGTYYFAVYADNSDEIIATTDCPIVVTVNFDIASVNVNKDSSDRMFFEDISTSDYDVCRVDFWINDNGDQLSWYDFFNDDEAYYYMTENSQAYLDSLVEWNINNVFLSSMDYSAEGIQVDVTYVGNINYAYDKDHECEVANEIVKLATFEKDGSYTTTCSCGKTIDSRTLYRVSEVSLKETSYIYNGMYYEPEVIVKDSQGTELILNENYKIEYFNNVNAGTATAKVKLLNMYEGIKELNFTIAPYTLADAYAIKEIASQPYTGSAIIPEVIVAAGNFCLTEGIDYTVSYSNNVGSGTATVFVTGIGNYRGTLTTSFNIVGKKLLDSMVQNIANVDYTGREMKPEVTVIDGTVKLTEGIDYTVSYANNRNHGTAIATVTGIGEYSGTVTRTFQIRSIELTGNVLSNKIPEKAYTGTAVELTAEDIFMWCPSAEEVIPLVMGVDYQIKSYINNTEMTDEAYAVLEGLGNFKGNFQYRFKIVPAVLTAGMIEDIPEQEYRAEFITPEITVKDGEKVLIKDQDYTVKYQNNYNAGEAAVEVTGIHNYGGSVTKIFKIVPVDISCASAYKIASKEYTGEEITLKANEISIKLNGRPLSPDKDYVIEGFSNNINASSGAKVTIKGIGNFYGQMHIFFWIEKAPLKEEMVDEIPGQEYKAVEMTPEVTVTTGERVLVKGTDYTVSYENNIEVGTAKAIITGIGNYTDTVTKEFKIGARTLDMSMIQTIESQTYTGEALTPEIRVIADGVTLTKDTDYEVEYFNNVDAGTATARVVGIRSYRGTIDLNFEILPAALDSAMVADIETQSYKAVALEPKVTVKAGSRTLVKGTDYTVSYENNVAVGTAKVTVSGINNYSGTVTKEFEITERVLEASMIQTISSKIYTGKELTPAITVVADGVTLVKDTDYTVEYSNNVNVGTAAVKVTGIGSYTGVAETSFKITAKSIQPNFVANTVEIPEYTGEALKPELKLKDIALDYDLEEGKDYTLTYSNNVNAGEGKIVVKGIGNYKSSFTQIFTIKRRSMDNCTASVTAKVYYTGKTLTPAVIVKDGSRTLVKGTDYTVTYKDNTKLGKARVLIDGIGNYRNGLLMYFLVAPKAVTLNTVTAATSYAGRINVAWNKDALADGYVVQYATEKNFSNAEEKWITGAAETSTVLKGLSEGKTYYVKAAAYKNIAGEKVVGKYSSTKFAKTKISFSVTLKDTVAYTGKALLGGLTVKANGKTLVKGTDYNVTYANNLNPGTATVTVKGIGAYAGTIKDSFVIVPKAMTLTSVAASADDPGRVKVAWNKDSLATGYVLKYSKNKDFSNAKQQTFTKNTYVGYDFSSLEEGVRYYVKITAYKTIDGKKYYGADSAVKSVVTKKSFDVGRIGSVIYTGKELTPSVKVTSDGKLLVKNEDYKLICSDNVKPGKASVKIVGIGAYAGAVSKTFIIYPKTTAGVTVTASTTIAGKMTVRWNRDSKATGYMLEYATSSDFEDVKSVRISNNLTVAKTFDNLEEGTRYYVKVASYVLEDNVRYIGNYSAAKSVVIKRDFSVGTIGKQVYNGKYLKPEVAVTNSGTVLTKGTDYKLSYTNNLKPGKATVTITGIGAYAGIVKRTFIIMPKQAVLTSVKRVLNTFTATWNEDANATGYKLQYSTDKAFNSNVKTININDKDDNIKIVSGLTKGKTYYVRVASYKTIDGTKYYGSYSAVKSVTIK